MAKIFGNLERASLEVLSSAPTVGVTGRVYWDSTLLKAQIDNSVAFRAFLVNDGKCILGNSGTAAENIRLHRGAAGVLQLVSGADATAEGSLSTALNQLSARVENYTTGSLPAAANAGRLLWDTTLAIPKVDTGAAIKDIVLADATQTLTGKTLTGNIAVNLVSGAATITLPTTTGTLATLGNSETFSNKTFSNNTVFTTSLETPVVKVNGGTSGQITINAGATPTSHTYVLPSAQGAAGQFLQNNGSGTLSWAASPTAPTQYSLTVTGTNWTTVRAVGMPYQASGGEWRFRFNITGTLSAGTSVLTLSIANVVFKNVAGNNQAVAAWSTSASIPTNSAIAVLNTGNVQIDWGGNSSSDATVSGDVELDAAPTL